MTTFRLSVKDKGRTVLPAGLQRACGFSPGSELVARPLGPGQFIVESPQAVLDRIWSGLPADESEEATAELAQWRTDTEQDRWDRLENPRIDDAGADERGVELLRILGQQ